MTDNEIIKALECCGDEENDSCIGCPYFVEADSVCTGFNANRSRFLEVLDLINRQKAEIEENEDKIESQANTINFLERALSDRMKDIERLQEAYKQCAWERDIFAEDFTEEIKKECSVLQLDINAIKSEAIKEFAERLKTLLYMPDNMVVGRTVYTDEIDNLVKEMAEGKE